jgi:hypothetical protein
VVDQENTLGTTANGDCYVAIDLCLILHMNNGQYGWPNHLELFMKRSVVHGSSSALILRRLTIDCLYLSYPMKAARDLHLTALRWTSPSTTDGKSPVGPMLYGQTTEAVLQIHQP